MKESFSMSIMKYTVTEVTKDIDGDFTREELQNLKTISGKNVLLYSFSDKISETAISFDFPSR